MKNKYKLKYTLLQQSIIYIFVIHLETLKVMNIKIINSTKLNELMSRALLPEYCIHFRDGDISINLKASIVIMTRNINTFFHIIKW